MALVRIEIRDGKSPEHRRAILEGVRHALVSTLGIAEGETFLRLYELDADHLIIPPTCTPDATLIEIALHRGYSVAQKEHFYRTTVALLAARPGIGPEDIRVVLHDPPLQNWGIRGADGASLTNPDAPPDAVSLRL